MRFHSSCFSFLNKPKDLHLNISIGHHWSCWSSNGFKWRARRRSSKHAADQDVQGQHTEQAPHGHLLRDRMKEVGKLLHRIRAAARKKKWLAKKHKKREIKKSFVCVSDKRRNSEAIYEDVFLSPSECSLQTVCRAKFANTPRERCRWPALSRTLMWWEV